MECRLPAPCVKSTRSRTWRISESAHGIEEGNEGSLVVYDASTPFDAIRTVAPRNFVLKDGKPLAQTDRTARVFYDDSEQVDFNHEL
jgi:cytosine deaminase